MKIILSSLFLLFFIVGVNAQQQTISNLQLSGGQLSLKNAFSNKKVPIDIFSESGKNNLSSDGFVPKSGCVDTLTYPFKKQYIVDQNKFTAFKLEYDPVNGFTEPTLAQVFKTGNVPLQLSKVEMPIWKDSADFSNIVEVKITVYSLVGGVPAVLSSILYTVPDTLESLKYIQFASPISVNSDFALAVTLMTPNKKINLVVSDPVFDATYDEQLTFVTAQGVAMETVRNFYLAQAPPVDSDFDLIIHPIVSYTINVPTFTATPSTICANQPVTFEATYTPLGTASNRFLNSYPFMNHFNFDPADTTFAILPFGTSNLSINMLSDSADYSYSTAGTYNAMFVFQTGFGERCMATNNVSVTVLASPDASFSYSDTIFCNASTTEAPTITTAGGSFSATPSTGLSIDASTGEIDFSTSTVGNYIVEYILSNATCSDTSTFKVGVLAPLDATFSYANNSYCSNALNPQVILGTGASLGTFSAMPTGLSIDPLTGEIDLSTTTANSYVITNTAATYGQCIGDMATFSVLIETAPDASFSYSDTIFCNASTTELPTITTAGGSFSATPSTGLSIDASTGEIDFSASTVGNYIVKYLVSNATCSDSSIFKVGVSAPLDATFSYVNNAYCSNALNPQVILGSGASLGTFSATPTGLSIDPLTGEIDLSTSTVNNYVITNTVTMYGQCAGDMAIFNVSIKAVPDASFSYSGTAFCLASPNILPTVITAGGSFSATPSTGLSIDASTGEIDFSASTVNNYVVKYIYSNGTCADSSTFNVDVKSVIDATITSVAPLCENGVAITLSAATAGGAFSGNGISNDMFDPAVAGSGSHTIIYNVTANGCSASDSTVIQVDTLPSVTFTSPATTCKNYAPITLTATPAGGTFSGNGVSGTTFDPSVAGVGSHAIVYTVSSGVCNASKTNTIVVDSCLAIDNADMIQVKLFPIPAENELTIFVNADVEVQVLSIDGKLLIAPFKVANEVSYVLNTQSLARGVYLLKLLTDNGFEKTQRIMLK